MSKKTYKIGDYVRVIAKRSRNFGHVGYVLNIKHNHYQISDAFPHMAQELEPATRKEWEDYVDGYNALPATEPAPSDSRTCPSCGGHLVFDDHVETDVGTAALYECEVCGMAAYRKAPSVDAGERVVSPSMVADHVANGDFASVWGIIEGLRKQVQLAEWYQGVQAERGNDFEAECERLDAQLAETRARLAAAEAALIQERKYTDALTKIMMPVYYMSEIGPMHDIRKLVNERKEKTGMQMIKDNMDGILEYIEEIEQALGAEEVYQIRDRLHGKQASGGE